MLSPSSPDGRTSLPGWHYTSDSATSSCSRGKSHHAHWRGKWIAGRGPTNVPRSGHPQTGASLSQIRATEKWLQTEVEKKSAKEVFLPKIITQDIWNFDRSATNNVAKDYHCWWIWKTCKQSNEGCWHGSFARESFADDLKMAIMPDLDEKSLEFQPSPQQLWDRILMRMIRSWYNLTEIL